MIETKVINHPKGGVEKILVDNSPVDKVVAETAWQELELLRTDSMLQPDRPNATEIIAYRAELRAYNNKPDFPNGVRPTL